MLKPQHIDPGDQNDREHPDRQEQKGEARNQMAGTLAALIAQLMRCKHREDTMITPSIPIADDTNAMAGPRVSVWRFPLEFVRGRNRRRSLPWIVAIFRPTRRREGDVQAADLHGCRSRIARGRVRAKASFTSAEQRLISDQMPKMAPAQQQQLQGRIARTEPAIANQ